MKIPTKEQTSNLLGILATASLTGIGFALGGTMGAELMKGIGINLTTNVMQAGASKLKEHWLSSNVGALNHDIQKALTRAIIKSLTNLENGYLELVGDIPEEEKKSIKNFFKDLNEQAVNVFPASLEKAVTEQDVKDCLYGNPETAVNKIWGRISHTNFLDTHREWFKEYFFKYFFYEMQLLFSEELKTENKECNRAWRAFQRLLLEGIQADVKAVQASQELIRQDLEKLDKIREKLELLKDKIEHRQPSEPFQKGLEIAIHKIEETLQKMGKEIHEMHEDIHEIRNINIETYRIVKLLEPSEQSNFKEKQELLEAIVKNYTSQIPYYEPRVKEFVTENRADELNKALTYLQDHRILLISGIGGVGKTTLARALIETRPASVPLPFWFDFSKKKNTTLGDVLEKLAGYLKAPDIALLKTEGKDTGQYDTDRLTSELEKRDQVWLVFDNFETILKDDRKFLDEDLDLLFKSLLRSTHNAKIIVTSRTLPLLNNNESLIDVFDEKQELKGLKLDFAVDFLVKNGLEKVEREKLEKLATGVDGHPLALRLLIGLVKKFGESDMLKDLGKFQKRKEDTIKKSRRLFEKLAGDEKELLENISVFRKPETMDAIKAMFTESTSEDAVEKLMDKSLLETDNKGIYWLHPLIRDFSYDDLKNKKGIHQLAFSYYQSLKLPEKRTKKDDVQSLIEACYHACKAEEYDEAASILFGKELHEDLDKWGEDRTLIELFIGLLPEDQFSDNILLSDKQIHGKILGNLGLAYRHLGQVEKAIQYYERALSIAVEIGDRKGEGVWMGNLGMAYSVLGKVETAIEHYQKALAIAQETGDRRNEGEWQGYLGMAYSVLGKVETAIEHYQKALAIAQETGDRRNEGIWQGNLGNAYYYLGQVEKSIKYGEQALVIAREIGDRRNEGTALGSLGCTYSVLGKVETAIEHYQKALAIAQEIGDRRNEGNLLGNLGSEYSNLGKVETAIEHYQKALAIAQEIGDRHGEGDALGNLGNAYSNLGKVETAIEHYQKALAIAQETGDRRNEGNWLGSLGCTYNNLGKVETAIEHYQKALAIAQEIGDRHGEGAALNNLGCTYSNLGKVETAIEHYQKALAIYKEIGYRRNEGILLGNLGSEYSNLGKVETAIEHYQKALAIFKEIGDRQREGTALGSLGSAYSHLGQVEKAIQHYEKGLAIYQEIGDRRNEEDHLRGLGYVYSQLGQFEKAIQHYEKALAIAQETGERRNEGAHLGSLGMAYSDLGQVEKAIQNHQKGLAIAQEIGDRTVEGAHIECLGNAYRDIGQVENAIQYYQKALAVYREIGNKGREGDNLNNLGFTLQLEKKYREALACYLLDKKIRKEIKDWNLNTESNFSNLKEALGENEFEKLVKEVEPVAEEIVKKMLN